MKKLIFLPVLLSLVLFSCQNGIHEENENLFSNEDMTTRAAHAWGRMEGTLVAGTEARVKLSFDNQYITGTAAIERAINVKNITFISDGYYSFVPVSSGEVEFHFVYLYETGSGLAWEAELYVRGQALSNEITLSGEANVPLNTYSPITINQNRNDGSYEYEWEIPAGTDYYMEENNKIAYIKYPSEGSYTIRARYIQNRKEYGEWTSISVKAHGLPTTDPTLRIPDNMYDGGTYQFRVDWDIPNIDDYTFDWGFDELVEHETNTRGNIAYVKTFWPDTYYNVSLYVRGKYNGYSKIIHKQFNILPGTAPRLWIKANVEGGWDIKLTVHGANLENKVIHSGENLFARHVPSFGLNRITIEGRSLNDYDQYVWRTFNIYVDRNGGMLEFQIDEYYQDTQWIYYETSPDRSKGFYWENGRSFPY